MSAPPVRRSGAGRCGQQRDRVDIRDPLPQRHIGLGEPAGLGAKCWSSNSRAMIIGGVQGGQLLIAYTVASRTLVSELVDRVLDPARLAAIP